MKASLRTRWLQRLRDPQTKQCRNNYVRNDEGSCCALGHLTESTGFNPQSNSSLALACFLDSRLTTVKEGEYKGLAYGTAIIHLNDAKLMSLSEIADWIEANVPVEEG